MGLVFIIVVIIAAIAAFVVQYIPKAKVNAIYNKIQPNMTYEEVVEMIGKGTNGFPQSGMQTVTWRYPVRVGNISVGKDRILKIIFKDGKVLESELTTPEEIDM